MNENTTITMDKNMPHPHPLLVPLMAGGLSNLTDSELAELDRMITPRTAQLLTKAFGQEFAFILEPLVEGEQDSNPQPQLSPQEMQAQKQELSKMMRDPQYWRDKNPEFIKQIADKFQKFYSK